MKKGVVFVVLSPSGGGKGSILKKVMETNNNAKFSVSATTRKPRPGENHGEHYLFVSHEEFESMIEQNEMLEHASYCGNYYGTPRSPVEKWTENGHDVILEIEVQGGGQVKKLLPNSVSIFILPPSMEILEKRLRGRGTETDEVIKGRLQAAQDEINFAKECDYVIINDHLEDAVDEVIAVMTAERLKINKNEYIKECLINA